MKTYNEIKKELNLNDAKIAEMFCYKNASSFTTSSAKARIEKGIENIYNAIIMKPLNLLKSSTTKKGYKNLNYSKEIEKFIVENLELTMENNQYANAVINESSIFRYEPAILDKKEGVRVSNWSDVHKKMLHRIYRFK